ncbi:hypothetical protein [Thermasporomyces composti]|jgi:hypothetical protein|uniref:Uncharacterized protein n=1 Tax=Thermasporomyces composti TaxID=696763 RepID=A0A3D9V923_THECX|nr:hypothetical protein [Thermasporomyces composti]REF34664.1 hypothetical protein DFJ64_0025 [Thermasporomyces composti]
MAVRAIDLQVDDVPAATRMLAAAYGWSSWRTARTSVSWTQVVSA